MNIILNGNEFKMKKINIIMCLIAALSVNTVSAQYQNVSKSQNHLKSGYMNYEVFNNSENIVIKIEYQYNAGIDSYDCRDTGIAYIPNAKTENHSVVLKRACEITKASAIDVDGNVKFTVNYPETYDGNSYQRSCEPNIGVDSYGSLSNAIMLDDMHGSKTIACLPILIKE